MTPLRMLWLAMAILGAIIPWIYFWSWLVANDWNLGLMLDVWNETDAGTGLVYDLTWAWLVIVIWVLVESVPRRDWLSLVCIPAGFMIGVSCALPLYLFLRSRPGHAR
ncbi:DUF2834 domain-containing protein [Rubrimonas cliftonensis]|uniref:K+-transporting ATPase, A chain n=1 Tax=Rubrimonas cliftonensis TaxID=89524 RepID=A0A1H4DJQ5_9RHOB|nr:DUF2834 domain-containing protein [Rubrimonas cliftonensis]SEA72660.1 Protein of unknown function [Rubrimonas cliftonensis]